MHIAAIKTHRVMPHESLQTLITQHFATLAENSVIAITSKVVSVCEGNLVPCAQIQKSQLIAQEAEQIFHTTPSGFALTLKNNRLIPSAGVDESNAGGHYILHPQDSQRTAAALWRALRAHYQLQKLGILITDSQVSPLRRGVTGIGLGWCGFQPLHTYEGTPDLYGTPLRVTQINLLDALATAAALTMGEGNEQTPLAQITDVPHIQFLDRSPTPEEEQQVCIPLQEDLFYPFLIK